jgi:hypothetical protein
VPIPNFIETRWVFLLLKQADRHYFPVTHAIRITYNTQLKMVQACLNLRFTSGGRYIRLQSDRRRMNQTAKILAISLLYRHSHCYADGRREEDTDFWRSLFFRFEMYYDTADRSGSLEYCSQNVTYSLTHNCATNAFCCSFRNFCFLPVTSTASSTVIVLLHYVRT